MSNRQYWVYILTNKVHTVLYTGVTNDLARRIEEHRSGKFIGFTKKYNITKLVFATAFISPSEAILAEKRIKAGSRKKKIELIESMNPKWEELTF